MTVIPLDNTTGDLLYYRLCTNLVGKEAGLASWERYRPSTLRVAPQGTVWTQIPSASKVSRDRSRGLFPPGHGSSFGGCAFSG